MPETKYIPGNARMSSAVIHNGTAYLKGVTARSGKTVEEQTADVLAQIDELLKSAGSSRERLLQATIWLKSMADFNAMNAVYDRWVVPGAQPVRACVQAALASPDLLVEVRVIAAV